MAQHWGIHVRKTSATLVVLNDEGGVESTYLVPSASSKSGSNAPLNQQEILDCVVDALAQASNLQSELPKGIGIASQGDRVFAWDPRDQAPFMPQPHLASVEHVAADSSATETPTMEAGSTSYRRSSAADYLNLCLALEADGRNLVVGTLDTWLATSLTSSSPHTDMTNASSTGLFDLKTNAYAHVGNDRPVATYALPKAIESDAHFGDVSHPDLATIRGVPLHAMIAEHQAWLLGSGCVEAGQVDIIVDEESLLMLHTGSERLRPAYGESLTIALALRGVGNSYCLEVPLPALVDDVKWLIAKYGLASDLDELAAMAQQARSSGSVALISTSALDLSTHGRQTTAIFGLDSTSTADQLARAAIESIALRVEKAITKVGDRVNKTQPLKISGGFSSIDILCQFLADQTGATCQRANVPETAAVGAALLASIGTGERDLAQIRDLTRAKKDFRPSAERIARARKNKWENYLAKLELVRE